MVIVNNTSSMKEWSRIRKRDGAIHWGLYYDGENPSEYIETFISESWEEHLRQHERFTVADREIEDKVRSFILVRIHLWLPTL